METSGLRVTNWSQVRILPPEPDRKSQRFMGRLASLGGQIERNFGRKNQLAVPFLMKLKVKENFFIFDFYIY